MNASVAEPGRELRLVRNAHGVHVRSQHDALAHPAGGEQSGEYVVATGENLLPFDGQTEAAGGRHEKVRHAPFPGARIARRQERGIDARQSD